MTEVSIFAMNSYINKIPKAPGDNVFLLKNKQ